jgi:hypothetical protein
MDATNDMPVRRVTTLTELARDVPPSRDLWPGIAAAIEAERTTHTAEPRRRSSWRLGVGIAASVALVAIGALLGRALPTEGPALASNGPAAAAAALLPAVAQDARHAAAREELLREADAKLAELPPQDRERVVASLAAIRRSVQEIEAALGREPANALLQELLVNAYQDEMRVLTVLAEARQEI